LVTGGGSTLSITKNAENTYHVLITANLTNVAIIDGFTVKAGNADDAAGQLSYASKSFGKFSGGGMFNASSNPTINNTTFQGNSATGGDGLGGGGGLYNEYSSPSISNVTFQRNSASAGGGLYNSSSSSPSISNTTFQGNSAGNGAGLFNRTSSPSISNTIFQGNSAIYNGGGMYNFNNSSPSISNTTFQGNSATDSGGGLYNSSSSSPSIVNSIFWENSGNGLPNSFYNSSSSLSISHSLIPEADSTALSTNSNGGITSISNMVYNQNPQFFYAAIGDLRLSRCSPAVNTGDNNAWATTDLSTDLAGNPRPFGTSVVDMGAYEYQEPNINLPLTESIADGRNPIYIGVYSITTEGPILNTNNAVFKAGHSIELLPGFSVAPTAGAATVFRAEIGDGCEYDIE
jgi:predicted outer membrane repeat protein